MLETATRPVDDLAALVEIERLESQGDRRTLVLLTDLYTQWAALALDYAHLQDCAIRLRPSACEAVPRGKVALRSAGKMLDDSGLDAADPGSGAGKVPRTHRCGTFRPHDPRSVALPSTTRALHGEPTIEVPSPMSNSALY